MARLYETYAYYGSDEEILQLQVDYLDTGSVTPVNMLDLQGLVLAVSNNWLVQPIGPLLPIGWRLYGIEARTEAAGSGSSVGPGRWGRVINRELGQSVEQPMADIVTVNVRMFGDNAEGDRVTGGFRMSGLRKGDVDCNVLDDTFRNAFQTTINNIYPPTLQINQQPFSRAIRHKPADQPESAVIADSLSVSNRVGIQRQRVGNVPQKRGRTVVQP